MEEENKSNEGAGQEEWSSAAGPTIPVEPVTPVQPVSPVAPGQPGGPGAVVLGSAASAARAFGRDARGDWCQPGRWLGMGASTSSTSRRAWWRAAMGISLWSVLGAGTAAATEPGDPAALSRWLDCHRRGIGDRARHGCRVRSGSRGLALEYLVHPAAIHKSALGLVWFRQLPLRLRQLPLRGQLRVGIVELGGL